MRLLPSYLLFALGLTSSVSVALPSFDPDFELAIHESIVETENGCCLIQIYKQEERPWACDIRGWVRAPDLSPDKTHPAHARLAVNGSDCQDIIGWNVGLRFKERSIVKLREVTPTPRPFMSRNLEPDAFPIKPKWNHSAFEVNHDIDRNNVFSAGYSFGRSDPYGGMMEKYELAIQNRSLWEVHGLERVVFDIQQELPLSDFTFTAESIERENRFDSVQSFAVHVPNTNFPPIKANHYDSNMGGDEQMVRTETQMEYYFSLLLVNGTVLDIPAGRAGFIPSTKPISPSHSPFTLKDSLLDRSSVSKKVELNAPRLKKDKNIDNSDTYRDKRPSAPECDDGNLAQFTVDIQPLSQPAVQGQNLTLNLTLTRTGNGTEYPLSLDVGHITQSNLTWLWEHQHILTEEEYDNLVNPPNQGHILHLDSQATEMLMVQSEEALQKHRQRILEERERNGMMMSSHSWRFDMPRKGYVRHVFDKNKIEGGESDEYTFQVELPIAYNDFPTFQMTFQTLRSALDFKLRTTYGCLKPFKEINSISEDRPYSVNQNTKDEKWTPYNLPLPAETKKECHEQGYESRYRNEPHSGSIHLDISFSSPSSDKSTSTSTSIPVHYLDEEALSPRLSKKMEDKVTYEPLNQELREETEDELRKSRYGEVERNQRQYMIRGNSGGGWMHAAKLWQRYERELKHETDVSHSERKEGVDDHSEGELKNSFIVQV